MRALGISRTLVSAGEILTAVAVRKTPCSWMRVLCARGRREDAHSTDESDEQVIADGLPYQGLRALMMLAHRAYFHQTMPTALRRRSQGRAPCA